MKNFVFWTLAVVITIAAVIYQRKTGPTNPIEAKIATTSGVYSVKLLRSLETDIKPGDGKAAESGVHTSPFEFEAKGLNDNISVTLYYKRYPSTDEYTPLIMKQSGDLFEVNLPSQPPAGKIQYYLSVNDGVQEQDVYKENPVILRFKNSVPASILIPHILLMFFAMLIATYTGVIALAGSDKCKKYALITVIFLFIGGLVLGPIVQKYAFGVYWSGWPFGHDLTDNKTIVMFIVWLAALLLNRKKVRRWLYIAAALLTLAVYSIPHSMLGSQYNYEQPANNN